MRAEAFAAARRDSLLAADERLDPVVHAGLTAYLAGNDRWYTGVIETASQIWIEHYQAESPGRSFDRALVRFREGLAETLSKTTQPTGDVTEGQTGRITRWLSTYAINAGTTSGAYGRGIRHKRWATMDDADVREIHQPLDGQVVPIGSTFDVAGTRMPYPGAPVGPPKVWIECRCVVQPASREGETMSANTFAMNGQDGAFAVQPVDEVPIANPDGTPYTGALVVLLPAKDDPIVAASSEPAHVTTIWMGEQADLDADTPEYPQIDLDTLMQEVRQYAADLDGPVVVPVSQRGTLGDDGADVIFLQPTDALVALRDGLLQEEQIGTAHAHAEQFPEWTPHITLGYPERPARGEYDADEVTFDRIGLWLGGEHYDYPMGGTVSDTVTADASSTDEIDDQSDLTDAPAEVVPEDVDDEDEPLDPLIPIHGVLAPEGILSGDGRGFREGAVTSRALPLHYRYEFIGSHGGNQTSQAVTVGTINEVWRHTDGMNRFRGYIDSSRPYADQALADIIMGIGFNSIDADAMEQDVSMYFDADGNMIDVPIDPESAGKQPETWYSAVRVAGLTQVPIQAFPETYTALGHDFEEDMTEEQLVAAAAVLEDCGCGEGVELEELAVPAGANFASGGFVRPGTMALVGEQGPEAVIPLSHPGTFAPGTKDGPGWITHPQATKRIRNYWTRGKGAAKIGWGTPGDFNRCRAQLAKYVQNPEWLAGLCANMHYEVLKKWPGPGKGKGRHALAASADTDRPSMTLVASGHRVYSSASFKEPAEPRAFPMRINRETREIQGYAAQWGTCHIGIQGMCQEAPKSATNYSYFRKGIVETDAGEQSVGLITFGIGHAGDRVSAAAATAHYDQTDAVKAYINIGENAYGIWYSGVLAPWVTDDDIDAMLAIRRVSGDWRNWSGRYGDLEMVGLVCVNTEGFQLAASAALDGMVGGVQTVAIGIGAVPIEDEVLTASAAGETHEQFVQRLAVEVARITEFRARQAAARERIHQLRVLDARTRIGRL